MTAPDETNAHLLALWDIDHTLIENNGVSKDIYAGAFELITGRKPEEPASTEGRTDPEIMRDLLLGNGVDFTREISDRLPEILISAMRSHTENLRVRGMALPGILNALTNLRRYPRAVQSIVTGNIQQNALSKLKTFELDRFFDLDIGGYGSDAPDRSGLVSVARDRLIEKYGPDYNDPCIIVIGDTPRDIQAGLAGGAYTIGVATGSYSMTNLQAEGADVVFPDLSNTRVFLEAVRSLRSRHSSHMPAVTGEAAGEIIDSAWAYATAQRLLSKLDNRWRHVQAVGERARFIGQALPKRERELLVTSALLHDIGYSNELVSTGFHPLDGARWLRSVGATPRLCSLVAHHSCAAIEAEERGLKDELDAEFVVERSPTSDALTSADMTVGPDGSAVSVEARLAEILVRYPPSHVVHRAIRRASPLLTGAVRRSEARLRSSLGIGSSSRLRKASNIHVHSHPDPQSTCG